MKEWNKLTQEEKNEIVCTAWAWRQVHRDHVTRLARSAETEYSPSGSDLWHPELWKPAHWKWFERGHD